jgi:hypothetical protein
MSQQMVQDSRGMKKTVGRVGVRVILLALFALSLASAPAFAGTAEEISALPTLDAFNRTESPLSNSGKWSALAWDNSTSGSSTGRVFTSGWAPFDGFPTVNGAYWNPATFSDSPGDAAAIKLQLGPGGGERYVSLWLDMPNPGSAKTGYQLRWISSGSVYTVKLSKWSAGTETVLASSTLVSIPANSTLAISDTGGTVTAWQSTGGSLSSLLSASDSSFASGYAGVEGSGNSSRHLEFKAGTLIPPPDTTITAGPKGVIVPFVPFSFTGTEGTSGFECSLDGSAYVACTSPNTYSGMAEGSHTFRVRAVNAGGADPSPAERSFQSAQAAQAVGKVAILDNFERSEVPLATGKFTKNQWAAAIGGAWMGSYRGFGSGSGLSGAYWNPGAFSDGEGTVLVSGVVGTGATPSGQYLALWLDMPEPGTARSGYEARFTGNGTNYTVELSRWVGGNRSVLASTTGFALPVGTTMALTETAGNMITLWTGTSSLTPLLAAMDSTYSSGYASLDVNGGAGTIYNFRAGRIDLQAPDTSITSGPSGAVLPSEVSFGFSATESGSTFECLLDGGSYATCTSPKAYPGLAAGAHVFKVRATDNVGNQDPTPAERSFEVIPAPVVSTGAATAVKATQATLGASVNPKGSATTYQFEYGTTTSYGSKAPASAKSAGSGSASVEVSEPISGLTAGTTYHFRIVATNGAGTSKGEDKTFTTTAAPVATTEAATAVKGKEATLNATVNPRGAATSYFFEYGPTTSYGSKAPATPKEAGSSYSGQSLAVTAAGLTDGIGYHFRVVATNEVGTTYGADQSFQTLPLPTVVTAEGALGVDDSEAVLTGAVDPNGVQTNYSFEYGPTTAYGTTIDAEEDVLGNSGVEKEEGIVELEPETTYHYRVTAESAAGTVFGPDETLTTAARQTTSKSVPSDFYGVHWGHPDDMDEKRGAEMARCSGARWLRIELFHLPDKTYDEIFRLAAQRGITVLPILGSGTIEAEQGGTRPAWRANVRAALERYGVNGSFWQAHSGIANFAPKYWEIWNEPNYKANAPASGVDPEAYGDLLGEAADVIHSVNPNAKIVLGGLLSVGKVTNQEKFEVGAFIRRMKHANDYDAVALHPYAFQTFAGNVPTGPNGVDDVVKKIKGNLREARAAIAPSKPIWVTEIGWPVAGGGYSSDGSHVPVSPEIQRDLLNATFSMFENMANADNIEHVIYYNLQDQTNSQWFFHTGLRGEYNQNNVAQYRPAWYAFQSHAGFSGQCPKPPKNKHKSKNVKPHRLAETTTINPYGSPTRYWLKWGPGPSSQQFGNFTEAQSVPEIEEGDVDREALLSGLAPGQTYHYTVVAENDAGEKTEDPEDPNVGGYQFTTPPSTETTGTAERVLHGQPGWAWVGGWVKEGAIGGEGPGLDGVQVNVNFKRDPSEPNPIASAHPVVHNGQYDTGYVGLGKGHWYFRTVFPAQGEYDQSESEYHDFYIRDGVQIIAKHSGKCMDVNGASTANGVAVMHGECHNPVTAQNQVFTLVPQGENFQIVARHSGKCVEVTGASAAEGAPIQQFDCLGVGQTNQLFQEVWWGESQYANYVAKHSGKCLDVQGGSTGWAPFQQLTCNATLQQQFHLEPVESGPIPTESFLTVDQALHGSPGLVSFHGHLLAGTYSMANRIVHVEFDNADTGGWDTSGGDMSLTVDGNGFFESRDFPLAAGHWNVRARFVGNSEFAESLTSPQNFTIKRGYIAVNRFSNQCLQLSENKNQNGQAFIQWPCSAVNGNGQVFSFWPRGNGWYDIRINGTNRCFDVAGANPNNDAVLQLWDCLGAAQYNQHWHREPIAGQPGWYALIARHSGRCLAQDHWNTAPGTRLYQWDCVWVGNQQWELQGVIDP